MSFKNRIMGRLGKNHKYAFSIVIAVYNAEKYLDETIESILSQSFDFNRVQVILVDDGSSDGSADICKGYVERYPDNFIYVRQENQGQARARNNGLDYAEGEFVNFLDSDDRLDEDTLREVYDGFKKWGKRIDVIAIPRYAFGRVSEPLMFYDKYLNARIVDILKEYDFPQVSASASFIRADAITRKFNPDLVISEDSLFINQIILEKCAFGVLPTRYLYRKRDEEDSTIDTRKTQKAYFSTRIELYLKELICESMNMYGEVLKYVQSVLIYDLYWLLTQGSEIGVLDADETRKYYAGIRDVFGHIDDDIIMSGNYRKSMKYHMLSVKYGNCDFDIMDDVLQFNGSDFDRLSNYMIYVTDIDVKGDCIHIEFYYEFYPIDFSISAFVNGNRIELDFIDVEKTMSMKRSVLNKHFYSIDLPILDASNEISFKRKMESQDYELKLRNRTEPNENIEFDEYKITIN